MVQKEGNWVPYKLKERDMERRLVICEMLRQWQQRKGFLHRIVTGDEKWIYYDNPKHLKAWVMPGEPGPSTPKRNIHASKIMLCTSWDQRSIIYYELLKPSETITGDRYRLQLIRLNQALKEKRPEWDNRHNKLILLHDNARPHVAKPVKKYLEEVKWEILPHLGCIHRILPLQISFCSNPCSRHFWRTIQFLWRYQKMAWWMDRFKRIRFFHSRNPFITGKVEESCRFRRSILWINSLI